MVDVRRTVRNAAPLAVLFLIAAGLASVPPAAASVTSATPAALAQNLAGEGVAVSNVAMKGSGALFEEADPDLIGFERGVVLSTGNADYGSSNADTGSTGDASGTGDTDLAGLTNGPTRDTTVLGFDVVPESDTMTFRYVFASEEYDEYVYEGFNDVFGFFVTRSGGTTKQNCAVVETGTGVAPVSIDTINNGNPDLPDQAARNSDLYRDNVGGGLAAEPDGFTTVLECVATVTPFATNRLKLAITDVGDTALDSWVFVEESSVQSIPECTINGTDGDDRIVGTPGEDVICGLGGDDVLLGEGGNDAVLGGPGEDDVIGGPGRDNVLGGEDNDALRGDAGNDRIDGGEGSDLVTYFTATAGGTVDLAANKGVAPGHATDSLVSIENAFGTKFADRLYGDSAQNQLYGGPGNDVVNGRDGPDVVIGTGGNDTVQGAGGADLVYGGVGTDNLNGGTSQDACYQGGGTRTACELGNDTESANAGDNPPSTSPFPGTESPTPEQPGETTPTARTLARVPASSSSRWYMGNDDYLVVFGSAATQQLGQWGGTSPNGWEKAVCYALYGHPPLRTMCSATNALQAVEKYQLKWFLWNAKRNGGCAIGIMDYGRHGVFQRLRWKTRSATSYRYRTAQAWLTPGRTSAIRVSDSGEVGGNYYNVACD